LIASVLVILAVAWLKVLISSSSSIGIKFLFFTSTEVMS
jgi:hypothetical protein